MKAIYSPLTRATLPLFLSCLASLAAPLGAQKQTAAYALSNDSGALHTVDGADDFPLKAQTATMDTRSFEPTGAAAPDSRRDLQGTAVVGSSTSSGSASASAAAAAASSSSSSPAGMDQPRTVSRLYPSGYKPGTAVPILGGEHRALPAMSMSLSDQVSCFGDRRPEVASMVGLSRVVDVKLSQALASGTAAVGNCVKGVLTEDLILGAIVVAPAGATISGHIESVEVARTLAKSFNDPSRRFKSRGMIVVRFDEIQDNRGNVIPIVGSIVRQKDIQDGKGRRETRVDRKGRIVKAEPTLSPGRQRFYNAGRVATMAPIPGNVLFVNLVGIPTTMAVAGGADPSFAYNKPMENEVQDHKRQKAFVYAFVTSLPGAPVVQAYVEKGNEVELNEGDVLSVNIKIDARSDRPIRKAEEKIASARLYPAESNAVGAPLPGASTATAAQMTANNGAKATGRQVRGQILQPGSTPPSALSNSN